MKAYLVILMRKLSLLLNDRGSAMVEAAVVYPIVILVLVLVLGKSVKNTEYVNDTAVIHETQVSEFLQNDQMTTEDYMRGRWLIK